MRSLFALAPLALAAGLMTPALAQEAAQPGTISIEGVGEISAAPDIAYVSSGVTSNGATAREALDANTADMDKLIATLKEAGIAARDIQTSGFSVSPNYVYSSEVDENGYSLPPKVDGYIVTNSVDVRVRDLATLGAVLDKSVTVGANTINGVSFAVADTSTLLNEARKTAFADAKAKAELYAGVAELQLDRIISINEAQGYTDPQPFTMRAMSADAEGKSVPVEAGELTYTVNVSVQWELADAK